MYSILLRSSEGIYFLFSVFSTFKKIIVWKDYSVMEH